MSLDKETPSAAETLSAPGNLDADFAAFLGDLNEELTALEGQGSAADVSGVVAEDEAGTPDDDVANTEGAAAGELVGELVGEADLQPEIIPLDEDGGIGLAGTGEQGGDAGSLPEVEDLPWEAEGGSLVAADEEGDEPAAPATDLWEGGGLLPPVEPDDDLDTLDTEDADAGAMLPGLDVGDQLDIDASRLADTGAEEGYSDDLSGPVGQADLSLFAGEAGVGDEHDFAGGFPDLDEEDYDGPAAEFTALPDTEDVGLDEELDFASHALEEKGEEGAVAAGLSDPLHDIPQIDVAAFNPYRGEGVPAEEGEAAIGLEEESGELGSFDSAPEFDAFADEGAALQEAGVEEQGDDPAGYPEADDTDTLSLDAPVSEPVVAAEEYAAETPADKPRASKKAQLAFFAFSAVVIAVVGIIVTGGLSSPKQPAASQAQATQPMAASEALAFAPEPSDPPATPAGTVPTADMAAVPESAPAHEPAPLFAPTPVSALESAPSAATVSTEPATPVHANPPAPAPVGLPRSVDLTLEPEAPQRIPAATPSLEEVRQEVARALNTEPLPNEQLAKVLDRLKSLEAQQKEILLNLRRSNQQHVEETRRPAPAARPTPQPKAAPVAYELMGAAAGKAVIRVGDGITRVVSVGQVLEGLGRVTRIEAHGCLYHERGVLTTRSASCQ